MPKYLICTSCNRILKLKDCGDHENNCYLRRSILANSKLMYDKGLSGDFEPMDLDKVQKGSNEYLHLLENKWKHVTANSLKEVFSFLISRMPDLYSKQIECLQIMKGQKEHIMKLQLEWKEMTKAWEDLENEAQKDIT